MAKDYTKKKKKFSKLFFGQWMEHDFSEHCKIHSCTTSSFEKASLSPLTMATLFLLNTEILKDFIFFPF